jgi:hypothetical protein
MKQERIPVNQKITETVGRTLVDRGCVALYRL